MGQLVVHSAGPGVTVQDLGRPGWKAQGLSTGGAADPLALFEAAALLGTDPRDAVIEMMGFGGTFSADRDIRFALTGARMQARIETEAIERNITYVLHAGEKLIIGGVMEGVFGYLAIAGGIATDPILESRATHLTAGIGGRLADGDVLPLGEDPDTQRVASKLPGNDRFHGGTIRVMPGPQTDLFSAETRAAFTAQTFQRSPKGNRQGIRLSYEGTPIATEGSLTHVSDLIVPGDIQIAGQGVPYILLAECQTTGGYPRIGSVIPEDLPKIAQAAPGTPLNFTFLTVEEADATALSGKARMSQLAALCAPLVRDPHDIADLLRYQLISGATPGDDLERP